MRNVEYITNGFGAPLSVPSPSIIPSAFTRAGIGMLTDSAIATVRQRGIAGIDQAINFFSRYDQSMQALYTMMETQKSPLGGKRGKDAAYEAVRRVFNAIASQVGTNPLINEITSRILKNIQTSQGEDFKFILAYAGGSMTDFLKTARSYL